MTTGPTPAGYSGTPLAKKLGIRAGHLVATLDAPDELSDLLGELPEGVEFEDALDGSPDVVLAFHTQRERLVGDLDRLADAVFPDRTIWIAWPKTAAAKRLSIPTDLTGDVVRAAVLETRLVDVKVCAISDVWSGLKAVWRTEHR